MLRSTLKTLTKKKLRRWLLLFFIALLVPTGLLVQQSYSRLKWETFHQHRQQAESLSSRIDRRIIELVNKEDQRSFTDYSFLNVAGDIKANFLQRSPLSEFPVASDIPGLLGYFQIDTSGTLSTPLLPDGASASYGISQSEFTQRLALKNQIEAILAENELVKRRSSTAIPAYVGRSLDSIDNDMPAADEELADVGSVSMSNFMQDSASFSAPSYQLNSSKSLPETTSYEPQIAFDRLSKESSSARQKSKLGRVEDLNLDKAFEQKTADFEESQSKRKVSPSLKSAASKHVSKSRIEQNALPETYDTQVSLLDKNSSVAKTELATMTNPAQANLTGKKTRIRTFESAIDPLEFSQLDSGHFVLFRKVWMNDQRYVQGLLIEEAAFLAQLINTPFKQSSLSKMSDVFVAYQGNIVSDSAIATVKNPDGFTNKQLYQTPLSAPVSSLQLIYSITQLPIGAGGLVVLWLGLILTSLLIGGFYLMYRLGLGQINLANQQQDFVSAVSHELKTPLTSIRMYGELLREGWATEDKKKQYYDFIFDESERLSRLINNVLQLARMTRNEQHAELSPHDVDHIMQTLRAKLSSQVERANYVLTVDCDDKTRAQQINVDMDWLTQIMINLVDNAIKFSADTTLKQVDLSCKTQSNNRVQFSVRDYGQGVDEQQRKKIFELFYRSENELTRDTVGTGIGLSLVHQMASNMKGKVSVDNTHPGAVFKIDLPIHKGS